MPPDAISGHKIGLAQKCCCQGSAPDPPGGAYKRSSRPIAGFEGAESRQGRMREDGREREGQEVVELGGKKRKGKGRLGGSYLTKSLIHHCICCCQQ